MKLYEQTEDQSPPFGIAGIAGLASLAVLHFATEPLLSQLVFGWIRFLIYASTPTALAFAILYRSPWHRELPTGQRVLRLLPSAGLVLAVTLLIVCLVVAVFLLFAYGPPTARKL